MHDPGEQPDIVAPAAQPLGQRRRAFVEEMLHAAADRRLFLGIDRRIGLGIEQRMQQRRLLAKEAAQFGDVIQPGRQRIRLEGDRPLVLAKALHMHHQRRQDRLAKQLGLARKRPEQLHLGHPGPPRDGRRRRPAIAALAKLGAGGLEQAAANLVA